MFKIELENHDFRKSLYFYIVDAGKKKKKKKKKKKNGLRQGACIVLNQELKYSGHWEKLGCGRLPAPWYISGTKPQGLFNSASFSHRRPHFNSDRQIFRYSVLLGIHEKIKRWLVDYFCACYEASEVEDLVKPWIFANLGVFGRAPFHVTSLKSHGRGLRKWTVYN